MTLAGIAVRYSADAELLFSIAEQRVMGMPAVAITSWTVEMLDELPDSSERLEIIDGVLYVTPSPSALHQFVAGAFYRRIYAYMDGSGHGRTVFSPSDIRRGDETRNRVQPDVYVVRLTSGRLPSEPFALRDLLLAIEVASPGNATLDYQVKRRLYLAEGVGEYWIADPESRVVTRWRGRDDRGDALTDRLEWHPAGMAAPLAINLQTLFDEAR